MATEAEIAELRRLINEAGPGEPWTDLYVAERIDAHDGTLTALAGTIWTEKAANYASLIDVQEGNSKRSLSQLHSQAMAMAASLTAAGGASTSGRVSRTRKIERQ